MEKRLYYLPTMQINKNTFRILLSGFAAGVATTIIATLFTKYPADHFKTHAMIVGFVYVLLAGGWIGLQQRSLKRTIFGAATGGSIGLVYSLSVQANLPNYPSDTGLAVYFAVLPCILSGLLAGVLGSTREQGYREFSICFSKGLISGLFMGIIHFAMAFTLALSMANIHGPSNDYFRRSGVIELSLALGIASAVYFAMLRWSVGLDNPKAALWANKLSIWKLGAFMFVGMTLAGIGWAMIPPIFR
jgi:hypothetical protein